jgi:prophage regulatory protein
MSDPDILVRLNELTATVRRSRSAIYRDIAAGTFPAPIRIGDRAVAWRQRDIAAWIESRPAALSPAGGAQ